MTAGPSGDVLPPSADDIVQLGQRILASLPAELRTLIGEIPVRVQDWPDETLLDEMGFDDPLELTGLFRGVPLGDRQAVPLPTDEPEMIFLFRIPILFEWLERCVPLEDVVFDVLTHEIGHFFGLSEAEVLRLEGRSAEA